MKDLVKHLLLLKLCNHPELLRQFADRKAARGKGPVAARPGIAPDLIRSRLRSRYFFEAEWDGKP